MCVHSVVRTHTCAQHGSKIHVCTAWFEGFDASRSGEAVVRTGRRRRDSNRRTQSRGGRAADARDRRSTPKERTPPPARARGGHDNTKRPPNEAAHTRAVVRERVAGGANRRWLPDLRGTTRPARSATTALASTAPGPGTSGFRRHVDVLSSSSCHRRLIVVVVVVVVVVAIVVVILVVIVVVVVARATDAPRSRNSRAARAPRSCRA